MACVSTSEPPANGRSDDSALGSHQMETEGIVPSDVAGAGAATSESELDSPGKLNGGGMSGAFILDSIIPVHATGNEGALSSTRAVEADDASSLTRRDGKILRVLVVGLIQSGCYSLADVHFVPDLGPTSTLVSVHQLTRRGFSVMFCGASCYVKDRSTGAVVGMGHLRDEDGFYHLDYLRIPII